MDNNCEEYVLGLSLPNDKPQALKFITKVYLDQLDPDEYHVPEKIASELIGLIRNEFKAYNENALPRAKWQIPDGLNPALIGMTMLHVHTIKSINCAGINSEKDYDILGIYQENGENAGIYVSDETEIRNLIRRYNFTLDTKGIKEVMDRLKDQAERVERCNDRDLIAVNNGIFNYKTKTLDMFSPDIVFTAKCRVNYVPGATSPVIHNDNDNTDWEIEEWVKELFSDGSDIPETIWQIMGAIIRPNVRWGKSAWFMSEQGNNGKGTLCQLMRNLVGNGSYAAIQLSEFGKDFMLEPLIRATSIITDENDVGTYIDKSANLKAVITNDVIQINRKFKKPIAYQFKGFMVQCINEMPRTKDKSESFYRRQLVIPFKKCYTGVERKYIKDNYLNRQDVLEYVLYRILNMNYYEITIPKECEDALEEFKTYNNPVKDFLEDVLPRASWDCFPGQLIYDMYKGWSKINNPNGSLQGRNTFLKDVQNLINPEKDGWEYVGTDDNQRRVLGRMQGEEPLLDEYSCLAWMKNPDSKNREYRVKTDKVIIFAKGLFRINTSKGTDDVNDTDGSTSNSDDE